MSGFAALCGGLCGGGGGADGGAAVGSGGSTVSSHPDATVKGAAAYARLRSMMDTTTLDQIKRPTQNVIILQDTATVDQALCVLAKARILSAPVVRGAGGGPARASGAGGPSDAADGGDGGDADMADAPVEEAAAEALWSQYKSTVSPYVGSASASAASGYGSGGPGVLAVPAGAACAGAGAGAGEGDLTQQQAMALGAEARPGQLLGFLDIKDVLASFLLEMDDALGPEAGAGSNGAAGTASPSAAAATDNNGTPAKGPASGGSSKKICGMKMLAVMRLLEERGAAWASATRIRDLAVFGGDGDFFAAAQAGRATLRELIEYCLGTPGTSGTELHAATPLAPSSRVRAAGRVSTDSQGAAADAAAATARAAAAASALPSSAAAASGVVIHRVAVCDAGMRITSVVSQTDVVRYLYAHAADLGPLVKRTALDLGWASRDVVVAPPELSALEAMRLMDARGVSALAVVESVATRRIIGNFSISELRTICAEHFGSLALPVAEFLALENHTEFSGYAHGGGGSGVSAGSAARAVAASGSAAAKWTTDRKGRAKGAGGGPSPLGGAGGGGGGGGGGGKAEAKPGGEVGQALVVVRARDTFVDIVGRMVKHGIHRVYVVDDELRAVGVVTCSDILKAALGAAGAAPAAAAAAGGGGGGGK